MKHYIEPISGDLRIKIDPSELTELRELAESDDFNSDKVLGDVLEHMLCNSEYQWVSPEELGALTDAPILGTYDATGTNVIEAWWYPRYELRSPQQDLLEHGECVFKVAYR